MDLKCNPQELDSDFDTIYDVNETQCGLNPYDASDAQADFDSDGLKNKQECLDTKTNINNKDTDGDGYSDKDEIDQKYNPNNSTVFPGYLTVDSDNDGMYNVDEKKCGLDPKKKDADLDNDKDGLTNKEECLVTHTNLTNKDTDSDGASDKAEIDNDTDPNNENSVPPSHALSVFLFFGGIIATVSGIILFSSQKTKNLDIKPDMSKPLVDFNHTRQEFIQEAKQMPHSPPENLDNEIRKKHEELKLKKMTSIFDEFAEQDRQTYPKKEEENVFERLDDISNKDAFEEIEKMSKKDKRKK
jgi:hypothetical protein